MINETYNFADKVAQGKISMIELLNTAKSSEFLIIRSSVQMENLFITSNHVLKLLVYIDEFE